MYASIYFRVLRFFSDYRISRALELFLDSWKFTNWLFERQRSQLTKNIGLSIFAVKAEELTKPDVGLELHLSGPRLSMPNFEAPCLNPEIQPSKKKRKLPSKHRGSGCLVVYNRNGMNVDETHRPQSGCPWCYVCNSPILLLCSHHTENPCYAKLLKLFEVARRLEDVYFCGWGKMYELYVWNYMHFN